MKTKARDIIEGWPRSRSVGGLGAWGEDEHWGSYTWWAWLQRMKWSSEDFAKKEEEFKQTHAYHNGQNDMVRWYRDRRYYNT